MSRIIKSGFSRRVSLLTSSSFIASVLVSGAGALAVLTPSAALAAPTSICSPVQGAYTAPAVSPGGTIACGAGTVGSLGFTSDTTATTLNLQDGLQVNNGGVLLTSTGAQNLSVQVDPAATSGFIDSSNQATQDAIHVISAGGSVNVSVGTANGTYFVDGRGGGINAQTSGAGTVNIADAGGNIVAFQGDGVHVVGGSGTVNVGTAGARINGTVGANLNGISIASTGAQNIYTNGDVYGGAFSGAPAGSGYAILAQSTGAGGAITIDALPGNTTHTFLGGIKATTTNANAVTITNTNTVRGGVNAIEATSGSGAVTITQTGATLESIGGFGIVANTAGAITITNSSDLGQFAGGGIQANGGDGAVQITNTGSMALLGTSTTTPVGISATTTTGAITINNTGAVATWVGVQTAGIIARSTGSNTAGISVTNSGPIVLAAGANAGIDAENAGTGTVSVSNSGAISQGAYGVFATGGGDVVVTNVAAVSGDVGIHAESSGSATVTVLGSGAVTGTVGNGVELAAGFGGTVNLGQSEAAYTGAITGATNGVFAVTLATANINVGGNVTGGTNAGILAVSFGGPVTINAFGGAISGGSVGISANSSTEINITSADAINGGTGAGIDAESGGGAVLVTSSGAITAGAQGILAISGGGEGLPASTGGAQAFLASTGGINVAVDGSITAVGNGIEADDFGSDSIVVGVAQLGSGLTITSTTGAGISATANSGGSVHVSVGTAGATATTTINAATDGIHVEASGDGVIGLGDHVVIDPDNYGLFVKAGGVAMASTGLNDSITVDDNIIAGNDATNDGIYAESTADTDGASGQVSTQVVVGAGTSIVVKDSGDGQADGGLGIVAVNTGAGTGGVLVQAGNGVNISVTGNNAGGIEASTVFGGGSGEGNVTVHTGTGTIAVTGGPAATDTANNFPFSFGISAMTQGAGNIDVTTAANITVSNNSPTNNAAAGVFAAAFGSGTVSVTTSGAINVLGSNSIGVGAFSGSGSAVVNINGAVTSGGQAGLVSSGTTGAVTIGAAGSLRGKGDTANDAVLTVLTGTGTASLTTVTNKGLIASTSATTLLQAGDYAIQGVGGSLVVANNAGGTIRGKIDVSQLTTVGTGTAFVTVNNAGTWNVAGVETLTAGNDTINNSGTINTAGATTFDLGAGTNTFTNSGTIVVGGAGAAQSAASLTIANVPVINNSGVIDVHDGAGNRSFTTAAKLNGTGGATLYDDAFLGGPGSPASAVTIGGSSGLTSIRVNNTNIGGVGSYIPDPAHGIVLVTGATALSNFQLSPLSTGANGPGLPSGATNAIAAPGMFFYDLAANGNKIVLISAPKVAAFQFAQIGAIAGDTWYTTTQSWFERQADLRDTLDGRAEGSSPAVWMKIVGDWSRRDSAESIVIAGKTYGYDTSYRGDTTAVIAGVDLLHGAGKDTAWVVGVQGGYVDANERFRNSSTRLNLTGGVVGVYASYLKGGLFVDGIVNGDILTGDWNLPSLGVGAAPWTASSHVNTWGGQLEAGYAFPIGASSSVEPLGSIAYGRTSTGHLGLALGDSQAFGNSDTLRGSLGGRVATTAAFQYYKVKLALEARVWDEFDGKTNTVLTNGGAAFLNANDISGVYGEVKGEANLFAVGNKLSAFVDTGIKWKTRYQDTSVSLGVRYQW